MSKQTNLIITLAIAALQIFAVGDLITSPVALKWMLAITSFIKVAQVIIAADHTPEGKPIDTAILRAKLEGIDQGRKESQ